MRLQNPTRYTSKWKHTTPTTYNDTIWAWTGEIHELTWLGLRKESMSWEKWEPKCANNLDEDRYIKENSFLLVTSNLCQILSSLDTKNQRNYVASMIQNKPKWNLDPQIYHSIAGSKELFWVWHRKSLHLGRELVYLGYPFFEAIPLLPKNHPSNY